VRLDGGNRLPLDDPVADRLRPGSDMQVPTGVALTLALMVDHELARFLADDRSGVGGKYARSPP
jgi:hypothetical protein